MEMKLYYFNMKIINQCFPEYTRFFNNKKLTIQISIIFKNFLHNLEFAKGILDLIS